MLDVAPSMTTLGIIGAGHIGSQVARVAVANGYDVVIANSRGPETLAGLVEELGPRATAATAEDAAAAADVAVVTVPLGAIDALPAAQLAGQDRARHEQLLLRARRSHRGARQGRDDDVGAGASARCRIRRSRRRSTRSSQADITTDGKPAGDPDRRALATAGDDAEAVAFVTRFYDEAGFDTVNVGPLSESWRVERDRPAYVVRQNAQELTANIAIANRLPLSPAGTSATETFRVSHARPGPRHPGVLGYKS